MAGSVITVVCDWCGSEFSYEGKGGRRRKSCSDSCRKSLVASRVKRGPTTKGSVANCAECGAEFVRTRGGDIHKFCSTDCRSIEYRKRGIPAKPLTEAQREAQRAYSKARSARLASERIAKMKADGTYKYCANCGGDMRQDATYCMKPECRDALRLHRNSQMRDYFARYQAEHGESYSRKYKDRPYNVNYNYRERHPDRAKHYDHVRRARMADCERETFSDSEIFERDGFVCGICDSPVDMGLKFPDAMSASLDHIIPLSRGGGHVRANVRLAHLGCNARKCARLDDEIAVVD